MKKTLKKITVLLVSLALIVVAVPFLTTDATDSFARVTLSDSAPEATAVTYTVDFQFQQDSSVVTLTFDSEFRTRDGVIAATGETDCSVEDDVITCDPEADYTGQEEHTLTFTAMTNPEKDEAEAGVADTYTIILENNHDERGSAMFAILEPVTVTARVSALLNFTVEGVADTETVHSRALDITTAADAIDFGTLDADTPLAGAHDLTITTNASEGYSVTVFQDQRLTSPGGNTISNFVDDTSQPTSDAIAWTSPDGALLDSATWGHFGFTSQDVQVAASCIADPDGAEGYFFGEGWAGFDGDTPEEIMCHVGPSDGTTEHVSTTRVGYQIEISPLQPAGDYSNTLTYIATPTF